MVFQVHASDSHVGNFLTFVGLKSAPTNLMLINYHGPPKP